ncbi:MAG: NADH-quinone oxidoreductase subunit M [Hydrogenibacillus sp.]|nr:NADH-quinone oxidoreductase subunit M [Hydrogenibacillus sp.]
MDHLLTLIVFAPLLMMIVLALVPSREGGVARWIGVVGSFVPLLLAFRLYARFNLSAGGWQFEEHAHWFSLRFPIFDPLLNTVRLADLPIGYDLAIDGLSLPLLMLSTVIGFLAALAAWYNTYRVKAYFMFYLLLLVGMNGVFVSKNILLFFIFFEITLVALFFLVGIWGGFARERAAYQLLIYNGLGSLIMLVAFLVLLAVTGSTHIDEIAERLGALDISSELGTGIFLLLLMAFGIKLPIVPFHTWVLNVHPVASAPISMILSGVLLKMGGYGLMRFGVGFFPDVAKAFAGWLAVLGLINLLYGAILALAERELKRIIAYSSVSHMGIVLFGIAALNTVGFQGAIFQMVSHGLISALLFMTAGVIAERTGTTSLEELGGLAKPMPLSSAVLLTGALASLGLPAFSGFVAEVQAYLGLYASGHVWIALFGALGLVLTAAYLLRMVLTTTYGPTRPSLAGASDAQPIEVLPMLALVAMIALLGLYPLVLGETMRETIALFLSRLGV